MINDISEYLYLYDNSWRVLRSIFKSLDDDDFYDFFTNAFVDRYEKFNKSYDPAKGTSKLSYLTHILRKDMLTQIEREKKRKGFLLSAGNGDQRITDDVEQRNLAQLITDINIDEDALLPYIPDQIIRAKIGKGLISPKELKNKRTEQILNQNELPVLKRRAWVSEAPINEQNFESLLGKTSFTKEAENRYQFEDPMPLVRIKTWLVCSKLN